MSLLEKYKGMGRLRPFLIYALCDETFSLVSTVDPPEGVTPKAFYGWISLLNYLYWVIGSALGGMLGQVLSFNTAGLDFALTALLVVLFLEQWKKKENRPAALIGVACAALCVAIFRGDMVIPAMLLIVAVLLLGRRRLCN
ncbi:MAG: AzlC family ABC transporter permease [Oscillibacter sp.]